MGANISKNDFIKPIILQSFLIIYQAKGRHPILQLAPKPTITTTPITKRATKRMARIATTTSETINITATTIMHQFGNHLCSH